MLKKILVSSALAFMIVVLAACGQNGLDLPRVVGEEATTTPIVPAPTLAPTATPELCIGRYLVNPPVNISQPYDGKVHSYALPNGGRIDVTCSKTSEGSQTTLQEFDANGNRVERVDGKPVPTATPVPPTATSVPTVAPKPTEQASSNTPLPAGPNLPMTGKLFLSPVKTTSVFNQESAWLIAEPGRICTPECPWTLLATDTAYAGNAQEGGFLYVSARQLTLVADGIRFELPYQDGNNNLVLIRGRPDDGKIDTDLNTTVQLTGFKPGHGIFTMLQPGAYVSKNWFRDQLKVSLNVENAGTSWSNCGALGCSKTTILLIDIASHGYQKFVTYAKNIDDWQLLETNMR